MFDHLENIIEETLIMDFSASAYASFHASADDTKDMTSSDKIKYWKYLFLNNIRKLKVKFKPAELIIAMDANSWRKKEFIYYKAKREDDKKASDINYKDFYQAMTEFKEELQQYFPFITIHVRDAEGDDVVAILVHELHNKRKKITIASGDKDFKQLLKYKNVQLWSPRFEKFLTVVDAQEDLLRLILGGDSSDGVPSIVNADDSFIDETRVYTSAFKGWMKKNHKIKESEFESIDMDSYETDYYRDTRKEPKAKRRQKPFGPKKIDQVLIYGLDQFLDEDVKNENLRRNFERNKKLITLDQNNIPEYVWSNVMKAYNDYQKVPGDFMKVQGYFAKGKMRSLLNSVSDFL